jgi:hypothetical protein
MSTGSNTAMRKVTTMAETLPETDHVNQSARALEVGVVRTVTVVLVMVEVVILAGGEEVCSGRMWWSRFTFPYDDVDLVGVKLDSGFSWPSRESFGPGKSIVSQS